MNTGLSSTELALLAHELRGAFTVIVGLNGLLRDGLPEDRRLGALEGIDRAVARANALIESALAGDLTAPTRIAEPVDLASLASATVADQAAVTGREVLLHLEATPVVLGDGNAIGRALGNLIDNALKYSLSKNPVDVTVRVLGASAVIEVADRGPGIPDDQSESVFEPFERMAASATVPGCGLGLTVVRSVLETHGGTATVEPRDGGGTIARLTLPVAEG